MAEQEAATQLGTMTSPGVAARTDRTLLVPVGSVEQHGPHLPLDTDTRIAVAVSEGAAAAVGGALVAPAVAFGSSGEHQSFAGTLSIGTDVLADVLIELGRSAFADPAVPRFGALVFVNGHGGNLDAVRRAVAVLVDEGRPVSSWSPRVPGGDAHAGRAETSLLLAIAPGSVGSPRPVGNREPMAVLLPRIREAGVQAVSPSGVLGDASGASAEEGARILAALVADLAENIS